MRIFQVDRFEMNSIFEIPVLIVAICGLFYVFLIWNFGYWRKRGVRETEKYPFVGSFPSRFSKKRNVVYDVDDFYRKFKKTDNFVGVYNCRSPQLLVLSTEYVRKIYIDDFRYFHDNEMSDFVDKKKDVLFGNNPFVLKGDEWKERRAELTPGLTASRVASVYPVTLEACKSFANFIDKQAKMAPNDGLDAKELCLRFTTEVVSDCVLGIKANSFSDNPTPILEMIQRGLGNTYFFMIYTSIASLLPQLRKIYLTPFFPKDVINYFFNLMKTSIALRRKTGPTDRIDFLNYMLQLQDKKNLSDMELTSHTMTFLVDGFETSASALAHTLLLLARHPEVAEKLRKEIGMSKLSFDELNELPYLDACLHESLRMFTPQLFARKLCTEDYELVNKNGKTVMIHPEQVVIIPAYSILHDPDIYEDPETYKPERFLPENGGVKKYRDMGAYFVFGNGPRICLGMRFALTQVKAGLVEIIRQFNIKVNPKTRSDNTLDETYFMALLKGGIWLDFEKRN